MNSAALKYTALNTLLQQPEPLVMGILNVTPDSFYAPSRVADGDSLVARARRMVEEGSDVLDVGACSTRPGSVPVSEEEELRRLLPALETLRKELPQVALSVDTSSARVAIECLQRFGPLIINDVTGQMAAEDATDVFPTDVWGFHTC